MEIKSTRQIYFFKDVEKIHSERTENRWTPGRTNAMSGYSLKGVMDDKPFVLLSNQFKRERD